MAYKCPTPPTTSTALLGTKASCIILKLFLILVMTPARGHALFLKLHKDHDVKGWVEASELQGQHSRFHIKIYGEGAKTKKNRRFPVNRIWNPCHCSCEFKKMLVAWLPLFRSAGVTIEWPCPWFNKHLFARIVTNSERWLVCVCLRYLVDGLGNTVWDLPVS